MFHQTVLGSPLSLNTHNTPSPHPTTHPHSNSNMALLSSTQQHSTRAAGTTRCKPTPFVALRPALRSSAPSAAASRSSTLRVQAASSDNPVRQALSGLASSIYKATASFQEVDASLPPLWQGLKKLDKGAVQAALRNRADPNEVNAAGGLWAMLAGCMC